MWYKKNGFLKVYIEINSYIVHQYLQQGRDVNDGTSYIFLSTGIIYAEIFFNMLVMEIILIKCQSNLVRTEPIQDSFIFGMRNFRYISILN